MPGQSKESCVWRAVGKDFENYVVLGQSRESCKLLVQARNLDDLLADLEALQKKAKGKGKKR